MQGKYSMSHFRWRWGLISFVSGLVLATIFPPLNLWWVAWMALVPLLYVVSQAASPREAGWYGGLTGLVFSGPTFAFIFSLGHWVGWLIIVAWLVLSLFMAAYTALFAYIFKYIYQRNGGFFFAPMVWVFVEWLRSLGPFGLVPSLGYSQWQNLPLAQMAAYSGVIGVSFLVVFGNALIAEIWLKKNYRLGLLGVLVLVLLWFSGLCTLNLPIATIGQGTNIALIQANHPQAKKLDYANLEEIKNDYLRLSEQSLLSHPAIIVWPETSIPFYVQNDRGFLDKLIRLAKDGQVNLILGLPRLDEKDNAFNSAMFISPNGQILGWVDKHNLVPFGEYLPLRSLLIPLFQHIKALKYSVFMTRDFTQSRSVKPVETAGGRIGLGICSDSFFPAVFREFIREKADYIFLITNDSWYQGTSAPEKHVMVDVFRAIESGRYISQCANTGQSVVIDPQGRVMAGIPADRPGILAATIYKVP